MVSTGLMQNLQIHQQQPPNQVLTFKISILLTHHSSQLSTYVSSEFAAKFLCWL